jgi:hypothetical protein
MLCNLNITYLQFPFIFLRVHDNTKKKCISWLFLASITTNWTRCLYCLHQECAQLIISIITDKCDVSVPGTIRSFRGWRWQVRNWNKAPSSFNHYQKACEKVCEFPHSPHPLFHVFCCRVNFLINSFTSERYSNRLSLFKPTYLLPCLH